MSSERRRSGHLTGFFLDSNKLAIKRPVDQVDRLVNAIERGE